MGYNQELEGRILDIVAAWGNVESRKMFGGICHLISGSMFCGVYKDFLILRLGEEAAKESLAKPFVREFDITGRPMKGWVMVEAGGFRGPKLQAWLEQARQFVKSLPKK
jgi:TfoX N-terminal domain